jgi:hypothetical protein
MEIELSFTLPLATHWSLNIFLASRRNMDKAVDGMHKVRITVQGAGIGTPGTCRCLVQAIGEQSKLKEN